MTNSKAKSPRAAKPGTLLSQWWTLGTIACDKRSSGRHLKAAWVIFDRYQQKYGNGRASLRYIENATGLDRKAVIRACRELVKWGYVTQRPGGGTRPSEYTPAWATSRPSGVEMTTTVVVETPPLEAASGVEMTTESFLRIPADKPAIQKEENDCGLATPDAAGLAAASPAAPQEESKQPSFEALWRAYGYNRSKKEARTAWAALPAEIDLAAVIEAAKAWQESWAAQDKPDAPRFTLARWLKDERYDEDAPKGFSRVRGSAKTTKPPKPAHPTPGSDIRHFTIVAHTTDGSPFGDYFESFTFRGEDGNEFTRRLHVLKDGAMQSDEAPDYDAKLWLCRAAFGRGGPEGEYVGRVIGISEEKGEQIFWHLPDENLPPDDDEPEPEPEPLVAPPSEPLTESEVAEIKARVDALPAMPTAAESPKAFAARMARTFNDPWPEWLGDDVA